jgi:hypothetical protein
MEKNLEQLQERMVQVFETMPRDRRWGSWEPCRAIGQDLDAPGGRGILVSAARNGVPIDIPAFTACELGPDLAASIVGQLLAKEGGDPRDTPLDLRSPFGAAQPLPLRAAHLPRTPARGRPVGLHLLGGRERGEVPAAEQGGPLRRGLRGRHHHRAGHRRGGRGAARQGRDRGPVSGAGAALTGAGAG